MTEVSTQFKPPVEVPDDLKPVDLFFRQAMKSKNAPEYVRDAWDNFLSAVNRWTVEEKTEKK
jgi:hypothetical protein